MKEAPPLPTRAIILGPSGTEETILGTSLILQAYRHPAVQRVYVFSPPVDSDAMWKPVQAYFEDVIGVGPIEERCFLSEYSHEALEEMPQAVVA